MPADGAPAAAARPGSPAGPRTSDHGSRLVSPRPAEAARPSAGTLPELLARAAEVDDAGLHLVDRRERATLLSWARLASEAAAVAGRLVVAGVEPGERVALVHATSEDFFRAFFGVLRAGAVPVPLYPPVRLGRLGEYQRATAGMLAAAGARRVLAEARIRRFLGEALAAAGSELGPVDCRTLDELPAAPPLPIDPAEPAEPATDGGRREPTPDDLGLVQFSSGTTVDPKPVALSHRAILAQVAALNALWPDERDGSPAPDDATSGDAPRHRGASWLPLYHDMGLIGCIFPALDLRTDLALLPPELFVARPALWLRTVSRFRATVSPAPNFAYALAVAKVRDEELDGVDLSSWRVALNGAETVSARTLEAFARRFAPWGFRPEALTPVYGLSEAALAVTFSEVGERWHAGRFARDRLGPGDRVAADPEGREVVAVGRPIPGFEVEVRDDERRPLEAGRVGRVWTRGPSLMSGYLGRPEATARALVDGWLDTGDLGFVDESRLYLTGRAKDVVVLRGRNYGPDEIEAAAAAAPGARAGCAVAVSALPEEGEREELVVFVERARDERRSEGAAGELRAGGLVAAVEEAVLAATGLAPDRVVVLAPGTLPRTSSGKLRRAETHRRWRAGTLAPPAPVSPLTLGAALVRSRLAVARDRWRRRSSGGRPPRPAASDEESG